MPLTAYQQDVAELLASNRTEDSYLAGGAALHLQPNSKRYSNDLDYFHDSVERVASAFEQDRADLEKYNHQVQVQLNRPGYVRAIVSKAGQSTNVEWAHDSAWRFMPPIKNDTVGYQLHPIDLAINKVLALAGRDEARDFVDVLMLDRDLLPLGALCWAAVGKDPGFSPGSLLELLKRRGRYQPEDYARLHLSEPVDLQQTKSRWLDALALAETFIAERNPDNIGCLYYDATQQKFVAPATGALGANIAPHFGRPGGVLPSVG